MIDEIISKIDEIKKEKIIIAIDGDCGSGKTTLSKKIQEKYNCNIIHMDDFFLQPHQRTPERLAEPGGNIDHERFLKDILTPLEQNISFSYQPFNCQTMDFDQPIKIEPKKITIIEGSYSHHPKFSSHIYDLKIFLSIDEKNQLDRILKRNGIPMYDKFKDIWIPMEKKYQETFNIIEKCDLLFSTLSDKSK